MRSPSPKAISSFAVSASISGGQGDSLRTEYTVLEVTEHRAAARQPTLPLEGVEKAAGA